MPLPAACWITTSFNARAVSERAQSRCHSEATASQVIRFTPAAAMRWIATWWASTDVAPEASVTAVKSWGPHTLNLGARLARASDVPLGAVDEYSLGGFQQLSGYRVGQVAGNYLAFGRLTYYRRLPFDAGPARALFAGGSLEAGNAWANRRDVSLRDLRGAGSLFIGADTGIGPLYLSLVSAPKGFTGLYLFLGRP